MTHQQKCHHIRSFIQTIEIVCASFIVAMEIPTLSGSLLFQHIMFILWPINNIVIVPVLQFGFYLQTDMTQIIE